MITSAAAAELSTVEETALPSDDTVTIALTSCAPSCRYSFW